MSGTVATQPDLAGVDARTECDHVRATITALVTGRRHRPVRRVPDRVDNGPDAVLAADVRPDVIGRAVRLLFGLNRLIDVFVFDEIHAVANADAIDVVAGATAQRVVPAVPGQHIRAGGAGQLVV